VKTARSDNWPAFNKNTLWLGRCLTLGSILFRALSTGPRFSLNLDKTHRHRMTEVTTGRILAANTAACVAAVLFGTSVVATRVVVQTIPPLTLAVLRFGQGAVLLTACLAVVAPRLLRMRLRDLPFLLVLGSIFFAVFPVTFNAGLRASPRRPGAR
jgi:hypothetical protein